MKRVIIAALLTLSLVALSSSQASAASYTLEPISSEQSKLFKNKPTVVLRIGKDTASDFEKLKGKLYGYYATHSGYGDPKNSEIVATSTIDGKTSLDRLKDFPTYDGEGVELRYYRLFKERIYEENEFLKITTPTVSEGIVNIRIYLRNRNRNGCNGFTDINTPELGESCWGGNPIIDGRIKFNTHFVSVAKLEEEIAKLNDIVKSADTSDEDKKAIAKIIEKAEATLNNQNALQADIDRATSEIENDLKTLEEDKKKAEEDRKKAEEEKKKQEESTNQAEDNKTQQTPQEVAPQSTETSTKDTSTSDLKSPNTGFNQSNSLLALISIFVTIILGTTIYGLKK